jgi:hypothetical protein
MKRLRVQCIKISETLEEAIKIFGIDAVYKDYITAYHLNVIHKMRQANKIQIVH